MNLDAFSLLEVAVRFVLEMRGLVVPQMKHLVALIFIDRSVCVLAKLSCHFLNRIYLIKGIMKTKTEFKIVTTIAVCFLIAYNQTQQV